MTNTHLMLVLMHLDDVGNNYRLNVKMCRYIWSIW